jgi:hypothetical protein
VPEAQTLFDAMTVEPSEARKAVINAAIIALQAADVWDRLDVIYFMAAHDEQASRLNWKNPGTFTLSAVNSPIFTVDRGWISVEAGERYLSTGISETVMGWTPFGDANNLIWIRTALNTAFKYDVGEPGERFNINSRDNLGRLSVKLFGDTDAVHAVPSSVGLSGVSRTDVTTSVELYKNGVFLSSQFNGSTISSGNHITLGSHSPTVADTYPEREIAFYAGGASPVGLTYMNATHHAAAYAAVNAYMQAVGADGAATYQSETDTLLAAMTTQPSNGRKVLIDNLITDLMDAGVWDKLGVFYVHAAHHEQAGRLNWKNPAFGLLTRVNSMAFAVDGGFTGNGQINALASSLRGPDFNTVPVMTQNSGHTSVYATSEGDGQGGGIFDARNVDEFPAGDESGKIAAKSVLVVSNGFGQINGSGVMPASASPAVVGQYLANRSGAAAAQFYRDGVESDTDTTASTALVSSDFSIGASWIGFTWCSREPRVGVSSIGGSLTAAEVSAYYTALNTYLVAVGAVPAVNYTTWNPADIAAGMTLSGGNLVVTFNPAGNGTARSFAGKSSGKWFWEVTATSVVGDVAIAGIATAAAPIADSIAFNPFGYAYYRDSGLRHNGAIYELVAAYANGDVIGVALDLDALTLQFYKNGVLQGTPKAIAAGTWLAGCGQSFSASVATANFGATPFAFTVPAGFNAGLY